MKKILKKIQSLIHSIFTVYAWCIPLLAIGTWLLPRTYFFVVVRSVSPQIALATLLVVVYFLFKNKTAAFLSSYGGLLVLLPLFLGPLLPDKISQENTSPANISFAQFNVLKFNISYDSTILKALQSNVDILSFQEVDKGWDNNLRKKLKEKYPYVISFPKESCCFGIALFSKLPLKNEHVEFLGGLPNIVADVNVKGRMIHVVSVHTNSPIFKQNFALRNQHLKELAQYLSVVKSPKIVLGDFNSVPWDVYLDQFKNDTKLADSRHSYVATYPSWLGRFGIPIDYIFHSDDITCTSFSQLESSTSDHHGVKGEFRFKANIAQNNKIHF
ncbi:MAG: endonuclease/exonuclease/phosphatase family protein [Bacteroidetes bacterium]|nr:endonuclease/exonuclease/phosphatase family protein [Bacteroidota bacterium]